MQFRRTSGILIGLALAALIVLSAVAFILPRARFDAAQAEIAQAVLNKAETATSQTSDQPVGETVVSDVRVEGEWAFGLLVTRAPDPSLQIHAAPDIRLFITRRDESSGRTDAALEYTPEFYAMLDQVPPNLIPPAGLDFLRDYASVARGETAPRALNYALPWAPGQTWTMTGGPHPDSGIGSARPWSALDLAYGPGVGIVRAAESGVVWRSSSCPNFIRIDHGGGYRTGYYHLTGERVSNGETVIRGDPIGNEGVGVGCGGYATGPHVHFTLRYYDTRVNIAGTELSGWEVQDGGSTYSGCMLRLRDNNRVCTPYAAIAHEEGTLPVISDLRYDYNRDSRPDLWTVNLRPSDGGTVTFAVYDGSGLTSSLPVPRTSLPQQPVELNTAFMAGDYNGDGTPDLWLVHRRMDSSGVTALRIVDGANPQWLLLDTPTALPQYGDDVRFAVADFNRDGTLDLYAIVPDTNANNVRISVVSGTNPTALLAERTAEVPAPRRYQDIIFALADYDADGRADLWVLNPRDTGANAVTVTVLGGNAFSNVLTQASTNLPVQPTDPNLFALIVTDYNRDGTPDLWALNRKNGELTVISGKNFSTSLYSGPTGAKKIQQPQVQVLGSDRARLLIAPEQVELLTPADDTLVIDPSVTLRFEPAGLAKNVKINLTDAAGSVLASKKGPRNTSPACTGGACIVDTAALGLELVDKQVVYWSVMSKNKYGSTFSAARSFRVDLPGPVNIISPSPDQTLETQPQFTWTTRPTATKYRLVVQNKQTKVKSKLVVQASGCTTMCAVTVGVPLANGEYWTRVVSFDGSGGQSKTPKVHFTLNAPPPSATPDPAALPTLGPSATSTFGALPTFTLTPSITPTINPFATLPFPTAPGG